MKAQEANLIAKSKKVLDFYECFDIILLDIKSHSKHGYFEYKCWHRISEEVEKHLLDLDYSLEKNEDGSIKISWSL